MVLAGRPTLIAVPDDPNIPIAALSLTRDGRDAWMYEVAANSRSTTVRARATLSSLLDREIHELIHLLPGERFKLALKAASLGSLEKVARMLDWKEFEIFAEECLNRFGYETERNVRFNDGTRRWEIDIVAIKGSVMLCIDCKHWQRTSPGRMRTAVEHQKKAMTFLARARLQRLDGPLELWGLPVILTLFETRTPFLDDGVLVSVQKLSDFLDHVTPYDPEIPFVHSDKGQKPIK